jgi:hypothetical protein
LILDLHTRYGDAIFDLWLKKTPAERAPGCRAFQVFKQRLFLNEENRSYTCWVKRSDSDPSAQAEPMLPKNRRADVVGFGTRCNAYDKGQEFTGLNRILNDESGESAESIQRYGVQSLAGFLGAKDGTVNPRGLQRLEELCLQ